MTWDGDDYQARFDSLAAQGVDVHGEVAFVLGLEPLPSTVLDAGCGTGRIAIELTRRGVTVVGVDADPSMLTTARRTAPGIDWREHDLTTLDLGRTFDAVVMAGNVPLFTPAGTLAALVAGCARHVAPDGALVAGFQLGRGHTLASYDEHCAAAGLTLAERFATWDRAPFAPAADYAVSVHRHPRAPKPSPTRQSDWSIAWSKQGSNAQSDWSILGGNWIAGLTRDRSRYIVIGHETSSES